MIKKSLTVCSALLMFGASGLIFVQKTLAAGFNPMNMMNPSKWLGGGNRDRYDDYDRYGPGYGGYYGPGYGAYGPGYGGGYYGPGYGGYGPGYGYGAPGYGYAPAPAYTAPTYSTPATSDSSKDEQIRELQERIQRLERSQSQAPAPPPAMDVRSGDFQGGDYPESRYPSSDYRDSGYQSFTPTYRPLGQ